MRVHHAWLRGLTGAPATAHAATAHAATAGIVAACTAGLIPAAALAAAHPGSGHAAVSATGRTSAASQSSAAGHGGAARVAAPGCATSGLVVWAQENYGGGYAGGHTYTIGFTNLSGTACTLRGYPGVSAVGLGGGQLGSAAGWDIRKKITVRLATGGTATARLRIGDTANFPPSACRPVIAAGLRVYPPGQGIAKVVPIPFGACSLAGPVWLGVQPVRR